MTSASTASESVPGGPPPPVPPPPRPTVRPWAFVAVLATLAFIVGASTFTIPYYAIAPGSAVAVAPLVKVVDGPSHPPEGQVFLCTVSLRRTTLLQALEGWLDPTVDVVRERVLKPPDVSAEEYRQLNLQAMDTSKEQAMGVAFEQLGYDAITGNGAQIVQIVEGSPADGPLELGEVIVAVDGNRVELHTEAVIALGEHEPDDDVTLTVEGDDGREREVDVRLGVHPADDERPFLGVTLRTREPRFDFPFEVQIASDRIGGPSAGLAFTLQVLDVLTEGELTGGRKVAATGTMELDGTVGQVGGVAQKTVAVEEAGVELFLVPEGELAEARKHAGKNVRVEAVGSLEDALRILSTFGGNGLALERPGAAGA